MSQGKAIFSIAAEGDFRACAGTIAEGCRGAVEQEKPRWSGVAKPACWRGTLTKGHAGGTNSGDGLIEPPCGAPEPLTLTT